MGSSPQWYALSPFSWLQLSLVLGGSPGGPCLGLSTRNSVLASAGGTGAPLGLLLGRGVPDSADFSGSSERGRFPGALVLPDVDVSWLILA